MLTEITNSYKSYTVGKLITYADDKILSFFNDAQSVWGIAIDQITINGPVIGVIYQKHSDAIGGALIAIGYTLPRPVYYHINNKVIVDEYYL